MNKFILAAGVMVLMTGLFHFLFIMYDYAWYDTDDGAFTKINEMFNETLSSDYRNRTNARHNMLKQSFGIARVICVGMIPVCFVIAVLSGRKQDE